MYIIYLSEVAILLFISYFGFLLWRELRSKGAPVESANVGCIAGGLLPFNLAGILIAAGHIWHAGGRSLFAILDLAILASVLLASIVAIEKAIPNFFLGEPEMRRKR
jgi:hypothetical protein